MKLSISEPISPPLCDGGDSFRQWDVTTEVIVVLSQNRASRTCKLQTRNWEGKQLWQIDIAEFAPWGLAVGGSFVFLGSQTGAVHEFDLSSGATSHFYSSHGFSTNIISTTYGPTGSLLIIVGTYDGSIHVWDQASKTRRWHLTGVHTDQIFTFDIKDSMLISTVGSYVALWSLSTGKLLQTYTCENAKAFFTVLVGDEILATGGIGGLIWLFDRKTSKLITTLSTDSSCINGLILYRPKILLSTDTNGRIYLCSLNTYKPINQVRVHDHSFLNRALFNNTLISGGKEGGGVHNAWRDVKPMEHGFPCNFVWEVKVMGEKLVVSLTKQGRLCLDFWSLV